MLFPSHLTLDGIRLSNEMITILSERQAGRQAVRSFPNQKAWMNERSEGSITSLHIQSQ